MKIERGTKVLVDANVLLVAGMHALVTANEKDYPKSSAITIIPLSKIGR